MGREPMRGCKEARRCLEVARDGRADPGRQVAGRGEGVFRVPCAEREGGDAGARHHACGRQDAARIRLLAPGQRRAPRGDVLAEEAFSGTDANVVIDFITTTPKSVTFSKEDSNAKRIDIKRQYLSAIVDKDKRFIKYENGIIHDDLTGLEWVVGPDRDMNWNEANSWARNLKISGKSWRLPTVYELTNLYMFDKNRNIKMPSLMNSS